MFDALNIEGTTWMVTETDGDGEVIGTYKVAVKAGGTGDDAIGAIEEVRNPPPPSREQLIEHRMQNIKAECSRRIFAVVDQTAQINLTAAASAGRMTDAQMTTYREVLAWVDDMRAACLPLIVGDEADYLADASWPDVMDGIAELLAVF